MHIDSLVIESTRRCNLKCEHCLRGNAQRLDMTPVIIRSFLTDSVTSIGSVTFSGGEPALKPSVINSFIDICRELDIEISNFYIATNGTIAGDPFLKAVLDLYLACTDNEISQLAISNDDFHTPDPKAVKRLLAFKFASLKYEEGKHIPIDYNINEGRFHDTYNLGRVEKLSPVVPNDTVIYLNCKGNVINDCDWSYAHQDAKSRIICTAGEFCAGAIDRYNLRVFKKETNYNEAED